MSTVTLVGDGVMDTRCWKISYDSIISVRKTTSPMLSPALSFKNRLEVKYSIGALCIISPQRQEEFLKTLKKKNSKIKNDVDIPS